MSFILQNTQNRIAAPGCIALFGRSCQLRQQICDLLRRISVQIHKIDQPDCFCFLLVNDQIPVSILIIAQQWRRQKNPMGKTHFIGRIHAGAFYMGLFLRHGGNKRQTHFRLLIQRIDLLVLKKYPDGRLPLFQFINGSNTIHDIACKAGNTFGNDHINLTGCTVINHLIE